MKTSSISTFLLLISLIALSSGHDDFLRCLSSHSQNYSAISDIVYTRNNSSYSSILESSIKNSRFTSSSTRKPLLIITPKHESQIQTIIICSKQNNLQIRTRSGGHDYEGLSYTSQSHVPFLVIDLINMSEIKIEVDQKTAWVQSGATIGQLYYKISQKSTTLAFPAGSCHTVGVGGQFSGGGYGILFRKHGLAADNIIDARLVDVKGRILDRKSMGEDVFWAIRGSGGASFGVITAWKLNLVSVPEIITAFAVTKTLKENATDLVRRWQYVAPNLPKDIIIAVNIRSVNSSGEKTILATFRSVFLGRVDKLLKMLEEKFPELGVRRQDCIEVSWIKAVMLAAGFSSELSPAVMADRIPVENILYFKAKSDYVQEPIPESGFENLWRLLYEEEKEGNGDVELLMVPYGGRMSEISESALPFPHRAGNLYKIHYGVWWEEAGVDASIKYISWIRGLYSYMATYVSKFPRAAYMNYRDLDVGVNNEGKYTSYAKASVWGFKYFKNNFNRLVQIKSKVDPDNFFRNEQSIPPVYF